MSVESNRRNPARTRTGGRHTLSMVGAMSGLGQQFNDYPDAVLAQRLASYLSGMLNKVLRDEVDTRTAAGDIRQVMAAVASNDLDAECLVQLSVG